MGPTKMESDYQANKVFLADSLLSHMPLTTTRNTLFVQSNLESIKLNASSKEASGLTPYEFMLAEQYSKSDFSKRFKKIKADSLLHCDLNDTNYVHVLSYFVWSDGDVELRMYNSGIESKKIIERNKRKAEKSTIPVFSTEDLSYPLESFDLYVINSIPGTVLEKYFSGENLMPKRWQHGYTRGYAVSEEKNIIIYWITVW